MDTYRKSSLPPPPALGTRLGAPLQQSQSEELKSPEEWQEILFAPQSSGRPHPERWRHGAAAALHGWLEHAHHELEPMLLSQSDYEAALTAASEFAEGTQSYAPHPAALSPHAAYAQAQKG